MTDPIDLDVNAVMHVPQGLVDAAIGALIRNGYDLETFRRVPDTRSVAVNFLMRKGADVEQAVALVSAIVEDPDANNLADWGMGG